MRRIAVVAVVLTVLGQVSVAAADPTPIPIREAAERAAREFTERADREAVLKASAAETLQASQARRRSVGRTVGGIILMGVGVPVFLVGLAAESIEGGGSSCFNGDCVTFNVDSGGAGKGFAVVGGGMLVTGALLASIWSDVPVVNSLDFNVTPQRVQVSKTFGF